MVNKFKDIDRYKKCTYYSFHDIINIKNCDPNKIKIDENSYKTILFYYFGYVTFKSSK